LALYGLIGFPLSHSLSYRINNAILNRFGDHYVAFETPPEDLFAVLSSLKTLSKGFNVTIPYKKSVILYLDHTSDEVRKIGAVNTVKVEEKRAYGYNTDYLAIMNLASGKKISTAMILGAGGGARAVAFALFNLGCSKFFIYNRTKEKGLSLKSKIESWGARAEVIEEPKNADVFVNATPMGMYFNDDTLLDFYTKGNYKTVIDLAYDINGTPLSRFAKDYVSGIDILIEQAALSIEIWKGIKVDRKDMRSALYGNKG